MRFRFISHIFYNKFIKGTIWHDADLYLDNYSLNYVF